MHNWNHLQQNVGYSQRMEHQMLKGVLKVGILCCMLIGAMYRLFMMSQLWPENLGKQWITRRSIPFGNLRDWKQCMSSHSLQPSCWKLCPVCIWIYRPVNPQHIPTNRCISICTSGHEVSTLDGHALSFLHVFLSWISKRADAVKLRWKDHLRVVLA